MTLFHLSARHCIAFIWVHWNKSSSSYAQSVPELNVFGTPKFKESWKLQVLRCCFVAAHHQGALHPPPLSLNCPSLYAACGLKLIIVTIIPSVLRGILFCGSVWLQASPCLNNHHSSPPKSYLSPSTQCCSQPLCGGPACVNVTDWASAGSLIASFHGCESVPWSRSVNKLWMQAQRKQEEGERRVEWLRWMEEQQARSAKEKKITAALKWI